MIVTYQVFFLKFTSFLADKNRGLGWGLLEHAIANMPYSHKWNKFNRLYFVIFEEKKKKMFVIYRLNLSSGKQFVWDPSLLSHSAQSSAWVNLKTSRLHEGSSGKSLVQISLPRVLLVFRHVASVQVGSARYLRTQQYQIQRSST